MQGRDTECMDSTTLSTNCASKMILVIYQVKLYNKSLHISWFRCVPILSTNQKLSKIETLRMARNYIELMSTMLHKDDGLQFFSRTEVATILSRGLSQATINIVNSLLEINSHSTAPFGIDNVTQLNGSPNSCTNRAYKLSEVISKYCQLTPPNFNRSLAIQNMSHYHWDSMPSAHSFNNGNWGTVTPSHFVNQSAFVMY